jgi:UDP-N-acetylmuramoyl-L-alanyl-D-glutamate--2,6-diaminopimelate ligase
MKELIKKFVPSFLIGWYHFLLAFLGAVFYRFPSRELKVIGVTGTNGKTTVADLTTKILEEAGYKVASLSSIKFKIGDKEWLNTLKMTMPGRFKLQRFLRQAVNEKCQYVVLEVTSEGIRQHRQKFINFDIAVFTNLTPEHIEAHGGFENYKKAKGKLFQATKEIHVINIDDENSEHFLQFPANKKYTYGLEEGDVNTKNTQFKLNLIGGFNIYNALAAICVGLSQGIDLGTCKKAVEKVEGIPGRMEEVISKPFKAFVDYAFTPNALEKVYQTLTASHKALTSKLICVLGACGGGRDKWKRPILGELAGKYCDKVIVTNEDPYDEGPMEIIEQVAKGAEKISLNQPIDQPKSAVEKILDRREAISKALKLAERNDVVIITGKGCEPWICVTKGKKIPWDDRGVVREEFKKLNP